MAGGRGARVCRRPARAFHVRTLLTGRRSGRLSRSSPRGSGAAVSLRLGGILA